MIFFPLLFIYLSIKCWLDQSLGKNSWHPSLTSWVQHMVEGKNPFLKGVLSHAVAHRYPYSHACIMYTNTIITSKPRALTEHLPHTTLHALCWRSSHEQQTSFLMTQNLCPGSCSYTTLQSRAPGFRDGTSLGPGLHGHPFNSEASLCSAVLADSLEHNTKDLTVGILLTPGT